MIRFKRVCGLFAVAALLAPPVSAQWTALNPGSDNIHVLGHLPLGPRLSVSDVEIEQEESRPFAYVGRIVLAEGGAKGTDMIDISDPAHPRIMHRWRIEDEDLHLPMGGMDIKQFKWKQRYYIVQSLQFAAGGPDVDLGAIVFDVTDLPRSYKEVARIRSAEFPGGIHNIFVYKHSDGRVYLLATMNGSQANVYDLGHIVEGNAAEALVGHVPLPPTENIGYPFYHDMYAAFHPDTGQDRFYGGGAGGYYVYDISDVTAPELEVSVTGVAGIDWGHTFTPSPDGRYAVAETEEYYSPLRIFDLKPALVGETTNISSSISAWTADWRHPSHNHEVRWPYVFVSGYLDGLQVFSLMDPENPVTVGYYDTYIGPMYDDLPPNFELYNGAFGVDVRNSDGLIVISDMTTGFWTFRMDGFTGWDGEDWGQPDISSVQKW